MPRASARFAVAAALLGAATTLSACETRLREAPDFGESVRQDVAAQIADPDARYAGVPAPGSNGARAAGAQDRYVHGKVTPPPAPETSQVAGGSSGGGGATR
jgi:hypothetical protein